VFAQPLPTNAVSSGFTIPAFRRFAGTDRHTGYLISLLLFFQNNESRVEIGANPVHILSHILLTLTALSWNEIDCCPTDPCWLLNNNDIRVTVKGGFEKLAFRLWSPIALIAIF
jgi:hypothetical protein